MLRGLLRWGQEGSEEGTDVIHRVGLSLHGIGSGPPLRTLARDCPPGRDTVRNAVSEKNFPDWRRYARQYYVAVIDRRQQSPNDKSCEDRPLRRAVAKHQLKKRRWRQHILSQRHY